MISKLGFQAMYRLGAVTIGISIIFLYILGRKTRGEKLESSRI